MHTKINYEPFSRIDNDNDNDSDSYNDDDDNDSDSDNDDSNNNYYILNEGTQLAMAVFSTNYELSLVIS